MKTLNAHIKKLAMEFIEQSSWYNSAPVELRRKAVIKMAGTKMTRTVDDHPMEAVFAECTIGEETRRFRCLVSVVSGFKMEQ